MEKKLIEIASEIVKTQVSLSPMSAGEIALSLRQVFTTLQDMQKSESDGVSLESAQAAKDTALDEGNGLKITPAESIQNDKVICLECGKEMRQLTAKHLSSHELSPREYRQKHGFTMRTPLSAKSLTRARSKMAKKRGLPENLTKFLEARRQSKAEAAASGSPESAAPKRGAKGQTKLRKRAKQG